MCTVDSAPRGAWFHNVVPVFSPTDEDLPFFDDFVVLLSDTLKMDDEQYKTKSYLDGNVVLLELQAEKSKKKNFFFNFVCLFKSL